MNTDIMDQKISYFRFDKPDNKHVRLFDILVSREPEEEQDGKSAVEIVKDELYGIILNKVDPELDRMFVEFSQRTSDDREDEDLAGQFIDEDLVPSSDPELVFPEGIMSLGDYIRSVSGPGELDSEDLGYWEEAAEELNGYGSFVNIEL
jgi:hypothetical protein